MLWGVGTLVATLAQIAFCNVVRLFTTFRNQEYIRDSLGRSKTRGFHVDGVVRVSVKVPA
jgi:hypothetical protein